MKRFVTLLAVAVMVVGVQGAFANCGKCPAGKDKASMKGSACPSMSKLNLTPEQKTKVDALFAECQKGKCDAAAKDKMQASLKEILTADQFTQWTAECKAMSGKGTCCAAKKSEK